MAERRDGAGPKRPAGPPWGLLVMLGLVAAIEGTLAGHDLDFTTPMHWDWRVIGKAATRPARLAGKDLLIFGDSLAKFGLMPRVIQERSGKVAYNFALHTGQASSSYFMLRRALEAGAKPSAVVLDLTPHMLAEGPESNRGLWPELLTPPELLDLAWTMRDPDFFASIALAGALPSFRERHEIRSALMASLAGESNPRRGQIPRYRRNWKVNEGAQLFDDPAPPSINVDEWINAIYARWHPHPVNLAYLDRLLGLARSRGIAVCWLLTPIHPAVQARTEANGFDAEYTRFVREVHRRFPEVLVLDARHSGFGEGQFMDGIHVDRPGAMRLSTMVADTMLETRPPGAPRWVAAKLGRAGVLDLPMEDVYQSAAVAQALEARKAVAGRGVRR